MAILEKPDILIRSARLVLRAVPRAMTRAFSHCSHWNVVRYLSSPPWPYTATMRATFVNSRSMATPTPSGCDHARGRADRITDVIVKRQALCSANGVTRSATGSRAYWGNAS